MESMSLKRHVVRVLRRRGGHRLSTGAQMSPQREGSSGWQEKDEDGVDVGLFVGVEGSEVA